VRANYIAGLLLGLMVASAIATLWFGVRSYRSFLLLQSAYQVGKPEVANVRAWMTLEYVAATYWAPLPELVTRLGLAPQTLPRTSLREIADARGVARFDFVREVQQALADVGVRDGPVQGTNGARSRGTLTDRVLAGLLVYGYPVLAATFLLGAMGLPVPIGLAAVLAGSLAFAGRIGIIAAAAVIVVASLIGDLLIYAIGRLGGEAFLARRGRWFGYHGSGSERAKSLFERWGGIVIVLTRTLVSHLSSPVSLIAGLSHYKLFGFVALSLIGRVIWTSAYVGLGYAIGDDIEVASGFLGNLTGLLMSLAALSITGAYRTGNALATDGDRHGA
jgi:membrane protein DedA with SNARE-associated domain